MPPRIPPHQSPGEEATELLPKLGSRNGRPLNIFLTLAHHPRLLRRYVALGGAFLRDGLLPARDRELVILRVAWLTGSVYEFGQHTLIGRDAGLTEAEISRLADADVEGWPAADRILLQAVAEMHESDRIGDATWARLAGRWETPELTELAMLIGFYRMTAGFLNSGGVELEPGVPGWPAGAGPPNSSSRRSPG